MRTIIIDDEKHCREALSILLAKHCEGVEILQICPNAAEGLVAIERHQPDLVFLDIEMPGMNGFDMLELCNEHDFEVIFTTAYNEYAIRAIRHSALDYLLKPVNKNDLVKAVERAKINLLADSSGKIVELFKSLGLKKSPEKIALPTIDGLLLIDTREIVYCESENNYTRFYLTTGKKIFVSKTLKRVEELLTDNKNFFRVHNSYLINMEFVQQYIRGDGGEVILSTGTRLPVSRLKKEEFLEMLERL